MSQQSRRFSMFMLVVLIAPTTRCSFAQATNIPQPKFTLTLAPVREDIYKGEYYTELMETNVSTEVLIAHACISLMFERNLQILVTFNGTPLQMDMRKSAAQVRKRILDGTEACTRSMPHNLQPGGGPHGSFAQPLRLSLLYDMSRPGTYTFAMTRETDEAHRDMNVIAKSNTVTVVIPTRP